MSNIDTKAKTHLKKAAVARAEAEALATAFEAAREHLSDTRGRLSSGDGTITATDLATAHAAVERAELLAVGADTRAALAHAGAPFRPILATAVAHALQEGLGIPTTAVETVPENAKAPSLFVMQDAAATVGWGGALAGTVRLVYVRDALHRDLDPTELANALRVYGIGLDGNPQMRTSGATLKVHGVRSLAPYVGTIPEGIAAKVSYDLAGYLRGGHGAGGRFESEDLDGDKRTVTLTVTIECDEAHGGVEQMLHKVTSAGRVVGVEHLSGEWSHVARDAQGVHVATAFIVRARITLVSTTTQLANVEAPAPYQPLFIGGRLRGDFIEALHGTLA